jgi:hypothetical protein
MIWVGDDWAEDHHDVEVLGGDGRRPAAGRPRSPARFTSPRFPVPASSLPIMSCCVWQYPPTSADTGGDSRLHTESDLRIFLAWCTEQNLEPLSAVRADIERYVRWLQDVPFQTLDPLPAPVGCWSASTASASSTRSWPTHRPTTSADRSCFPDQCSSLKDGLPLTAAQYRQPAATEDHPSGEDPDFRSRPSRQDRASRAQRATCSSMGARPANMAAMSRLS